MGADSKIQWTDHTFNPWWGCARVSPGCEHCYAEAFAKRTGKAKWGVKEDRRFFGDAHWREPVKWNAAAKKAGERKRVFCASMADVFEDRPDLEAPRGRLWKLIEQTPHLDWLLLTKRPENADRLWAGAQADAFDGSESMGPTWPDNVWLGTTVEDQKRADERIPHLIAAPAAVHFLSCEPLLGPVVLGPALGQIDWVIIGGESGPGARPFHLAWARSIVEQCQIFGTKPFVKQLGAVPMTAYDGDIFDGGIVPLKLLDRRKGGDIAEWPEDLRVREFPVEK